MAVVGDGVIGLATVLELARAGLSCALFGAAELGAGSGAAAGILAPSIGHRQPEIRAFFRHSLDLYPAFLAPLREFDTDLSVSAGLLEILPSPAALTDLGADSTPLKAAEVRHRAPALAAPFGAVLHSRDGAIDSTRLLSALRQAVFRDDTIRRYDGAAHIGIGGSPALVRTRDGTTVRANRVVLAAGAWSPLIDGLPRAIPVRPLKGQMLALDSGDVIPQPVMSDHIYLVPRGPDLVVGATSEDAGFDTSTTDAAIASLHAAATGLCPSLAGARITRRWAGLRPATPDLLPILGTDQNYPALIYACGHSRNGILLAPATAQAVRRLVEHPGATDTALAPFSVARF